MEVLVFLERAEDLLIRGNIVESTYIPELPAPKLVQGIAQQLTQIWVSILDSPARCIEDQNPVFGGFKEPPVAHFGVVQAAAGSEVGFCDANVPSPFVLVTSLPVLSHFRCHSTCIGTGFKERDSLPCQTPKRVVLG